MFNKRELEVLKDLLEWADAEAGGNQEEIDILKKIKEVLDKPL